MYMHYNYIHWVTAHLQLNILLSLLLNECSMYNSSVQLTSNNLTSFHS